MARGPRGSQRDALMREKVVSHDINQSNKSIIARFVACGRYEVYYRLRLPRSLIRAEILSLRLPQVVIRAPLSSRRPWTSLSQFPTGQPGAHMYADECPRLLNKQFTGPNGVV